MYKIHLLTKGIAELSICQSLQRPYTKIICPVNQGRKNFVCYDKGDQELRQDQILDSSRQSLLLLFPTW